jgi:spermidine synthase
MRSKSLTAAYFSLGAFALVSQTMILREFFVVVYGNEFIFGVLLANWLIGIFSGALIGSTVSAQDNDNLGVFAASLLVISILFPISITAIRFLYNISGTAAGVYVSFSNVFLYSALFIIPFSFFIGFAFPIAAKVYTRSSPSPGDRVHKISTIYIYEALGSLLSGIVYTFVLVGRFNPYFIAVLIILPLLFSCWAILGKTQHTDLRFVSVALLIIYIFALTPFVSSKIETYTVKKRWRSFSQLPLTQSIDSKYQNIAVAHLFNQYNVYLNTMLASVFPNDEDNMLLAAHLISQHPSPKRILVIGDAVSGLAKYLLRFDIEKIVSVEIDRKVVETILKFLPEQDKDILQTDKRFEIEITDGRKYVKDLIRQRDLQEKVSFYDIVYINVSEPSTLLLNRYYTGEFFSDLAKIVGKNGVIALKVTASENYAQGMIGDYTASVYNTVKSVFPHIAAAPGAQTFIFASKNPGSVSDNPDVLAERYTKTNVTPKKLGLIFHSFYPPEKTRSTKRALNEDERKRLNTDETPISAFCYNKIIGWYGQSRDSHFLEFFEKINLKYLLFLILFLFLSRLLVIAITIKKKAPHKTRALRFHTLLAVFSSGMAGMALELVILYTFQNNFGDIYHLIGFIIALFMFGLPLGALTSTFLINKNKLTETTGIIKTIVLIQAAIAAIAFLFPHMVKLFMTVPLLNQIFIFIETIFVGYAVGLIFPLSVHLYLGNSKRTGRAAGVIDAFDHMGAAVGAFFIGSLFLPVMGIEKICRLLALFPLLSSLLLFTDFLRIRGKEIRKFKIQL